MSYAISAISVKVSSKALVEADFATFPNAVLSPLTLNRFLMLFSLNPLNFAIEMLSKNVSNIPDIKPVASTLLGSSPLSAASSIDSAAALEPIIAPPTTGKPPPIAAEAALSNNETAVEYTKSNVLPCSSITESRILPLI